VYMLLEHVDDKIRELITALDWIVLQACV
jgi:hypothetical protein